MIFHLLDPPSRPSSGSPVRPANSRDLLANRRVSATLGSLSESARFFQPTRELITAVNVALAVGAPLLLTGEPGTGKTQVAHYLAWYFDLGKSFFRLDVRSTTTADDLLYEFDTVAYFHAAHDSDAKAGTLDKAGYIRKGPLWEALVADGPSIVLLDEIDKAPRDFPNDLLGVLAESKFRVKETKQWIERKPGTPPPFLIITSNSERRLPEPFLRRCIFHHIELTEALLHTVIEARRKEFKNLDDRTIEVAISRMLELRNRNIRKKPATGELIVWLAVLNALTQVSPVEADALRSCSLAKLPALVALVKDRDDLAAL